MKNGANACSMTAIFLALLLDLAAAEVAVVPLELAVALLLLD